MLTALVRRHRRVLAAGVLVVAALVVVAIFAFGGKSDIVVYNGRSQYGDEQSFTEWADDTGESLELRGGTAPELFQRLQAEGDDTPADLLVTTDLANLWRAQEAGLLEPVTTETLQRQVPKELRAADGSWWGLSTRIRTPMRSTERVDANAITGYEDLGDPAFRGRLCLRTSNNEYNQSLVADMLAKRGAARTEAILRSWMANDPQILGSDVDVLEAIGAGRCDVGLTNHYYLGRMLEEEPDFPVAPAWADQGGAGVHTNLSGIALVRGTDAEDAAVSLMEHMTAVPAQRHITENSEFAANPEVGPPAHLEAWSEVKLDPIDVARAGALLPQAVDLMQQVGWR